MKLPAVLNAGLNIAVLVALVLVLLDRRADAAGESNNVAAAVDFSLDPEEWDQVSAGGSFLGDASARRVVVEFIDYECPYCRSSQPAIDRFMQRAEDVKLVIRHFPIASHLAADGAARAAICAEKEGKFGEIHAFLLTDEDWLKTHDWGRVAREIGIAAPEDFLECMDADSTSERLGSDRLAASIAGVRATPTFVSASRQHVGTANTAALRRLTEDDIRAR